MKHALHLLALACFCLNLGCKKEAAPPPPDAVVLVGDRIIRVADVESAWHTRGKTFADKEALVRTLAEEEALLVRAIQAGLDQDPEVRQAWKSLLIGKLKERELEPRQEKTVIDPAEIETAYREQTSRYTVPARRRLAFLHLRAYPQMSDARKTEIKARLEDARRQAVQLDPSETDFGALAIAYSEDQSTRYKGGDLGWLEANGTSRLDPELLAAGWALTEKGAVSEVLEGKDGFYLLKLSDLREATLRPLTEVSESIRHELHRQRLAQTERRFREEATVMANVRILEDRVAALELPLLQTATADPDLP